MAHPSQSGAGVMRRDGRPLVAQMMESSRLEDGAGLVSAPHSHKGGNESEQRHLAFRPSNLKRSRTFWDCWKLHLNLSEARPQVAVATTDYQVRRSSLPAFLQTKFIVKNHTEEHEFNLGRLTRALQWLHQLLVSSKKKKKKKDPGHPGKGVLGGETEEN